MTNIKHTLLSLLLIAVSAMWLSSCDVFAYNAFNIQNNTDAALNVTVYRKTKSNVADSVFMISKGTTVKVHYVGYSYTSGYKKNRHDVSNDFDSLVVIKSGTRSHKDYLSNDSWNFTPKEGIYTSIVTNDEF